MRKAGDILGSLLNQAYLGDKKYANFIESKIDGSNLRDEVKALGIMGMGSPIGNIHMPEGHGLKGRELLMNQSIVAAAIGSNAGIRYGIPTAAGVGLVNGIGSLLNSPDDQTNQYPI